MYIVHVTCVRVSVYVYMFNMRECISTTINYYYIEVRMCMGKCIVNYAHLGKLPTFVLGKKNTRPAPGAFK